MALKNTFSRSPAEQSMKEDLLIKYITQGVQKEVENEFDRKMKILCEELNGRKNEIVAGVVLSVMKTIEFNTAGQTLHIKVREIADQ